MDSSHSQGLMSRATTDLHDPLPAETNSNATSRRTEPNQSTSRSLSCADHAFGSALQLIDDASDADKLIEFLGALIKDADRKVFLILDNLRVHHSKLVKAWVAERKDQIKLFYLPSYSPQLNPEAVERRSKNRK